MKPGMLAAIISAMLISSGPVPATGAPEGRRLSDTTMKRWLVGWGTDEASLAAAAAASESPALAHASSAAAAKELLAQVKADGVTDDAAVINAALADPAVSVVLLPAGQIAIGARIVRPLNKKLIGAGPGKTNFLFLPSLAGSTAGVFESPLGNDYGGGFSGFSVDGQYVGWGGGASARTHVIVPRGVGWLNENIRVKNAYGYHFWANSGTAGVYSSGIFRNVHSDNANVQFETTNADGVLFDGFTGTSGDSSAPGYANMGNEFIHPIADSQNITFRHGRFEGESGAPLSISTTAVNQKGIVLDDVEIIQTNNAYSAGVIGGTASFRNQVTMKNVRLHKPDGGPAALSVTHSDVFMVNSRAVGGQFGVAANNGGIIELSNSYAEGRTDPAGAIPAYGAGTSGTGTINVVGGTLRGIGPAGSASSRGSRVTVAGNTRQFPAVDPRSVQEPASAMSARVVAAYVLIAVIVIIIISVVIFYQTKERRSRRRHKRRHRRDKAKKAREEPLSKEA